MITLDVEFEKAIRLLIKYAPIADEATKKPIVPHDIRVGVYLYENNYSREIVLAGILHDTLEFTEMSEQILRDEFGPEVAKLVLANTKDRSIKDSGKRIEELVKRCAIDGEEALIVKAADTIDSYKYYSRVNNKSELEYCRKNTEAIFKYKPKDFNDKIFIELKNCQRRFSNN